MAPRKKGKGRATETQPLVESPLSDPPELLHDPPPSSVPPDSSPGSDEPRSDDRRSPTPGPSNSKPWLSLADEVSSSSIGSIVAAQNEMRDMFTQLMSSVHDIRHDQQNLKEDMYIRFESLHPRQPSSSSAPIEGPILPENSSFSSTSGFASPIPLPRNTTDARIPIQVKNETGLDRVSVASRDSEIKDNEPSDDDYRRSRGYLLRAHPGKSIKDNLIDFQLKRRNAAQMWYGRPYALALETEGDYKLRETIHELITKTLPHIEKVEQEEDKKNPNRVHFDSPPRGASPLSQHSNTSHRGPAPHLVYDLELQSTLPIQPIEPTDGPVPSRDSWRNSRAASRDPYTVPVDNRDNRQSVNRTPWRPSPMPTDNIRGTSEAASRADADYDAHYFIDQLVNDKVDISPMPNAVSDPLRKLKLSLPDAYDGKGKIEEFQKWFTDLTTWFQLSNIVGPELDYQRILIVGTNTTGDAATWFYRNITSATRSRQSWDFRSVIHGLYDRFLPWSTRLEAIDEFERCQYSSKDGARGYWERLCLSAARLPNHPDKYSIIRRFVNGLPQEIHYVLTVGRGFSAELSDSSLLVSAAEEIEDSLRIVRSRDGYRRSPLSGATDSQSDRRDSRTDRRDPTRRDNRRTQDRQDRRTDDRPRSEPRNQDDNKRSRDDSNKNPGRSSYEPRDRGNYLPSSNNRPKTTQALFDTTKALCYACGAYGHIASDPKCPKYGQRMHLAIAGGDSSSGPTGNEDESLSPSQVDVTAPTNSGSDNGSADSYDSQQSDYPVANDYPSDDDHSDAPRINIMGRRLGMAFTKRDSRNPVNPEVMYDGKMRRRFPKSFDKDAQPTRSPLSQQLVTILTVVNGTMALTCIDTGSTVDAITPEMVQVSKMQTFKLANPLPLQLACRGSRSKLQYGVNALIKADTHSAHEFLDVVNLDRYDCVLGIPFLRKHGAIVNLKENWISINGVVIPGLANDEEAAFVGKSRWFNKSLPPLSSPSSNLRPPPSLANATNGSLVSNKTHRAPVLKTATPVALPIDLLERRKHWGREFETIFGPPFNDIPLPPLREVNHEINLKDPDKIYHTRNPHCAEALREQLADKTDDYVASGRWVKATVRQALPLLCIRKSDGRLRTVLDARERNENTYLDVTPLPDQDILRTMIARAKFRTKIDMTDAFEQIRIIPEHESRTAFVSPLGTFYSRVIQQGDLNGPSTCQRLMVHILQQYIGRGIGVYLDDVFIYSDTFEEHEKLLAYVLRRLGEERLFISAKKLDIYSPSMDCLGHKIDDEGLHSDADKMARIRDWPVPSSYKDIQRFLGLVQYLQHFMPDVSAYASILSGMSKNGRKFSWREVHQKAFDSILHMASHDIILRPIDPRRAEPIWLICDASTTGVGAILAQGESWETARPAAFMSKRLTSAQRSYFPMELEALAALEGLEKFRDKLTGVKFTVVTDHQALEFFKNRRPDNPRHIRWVQRFSNFDFSFLYVRGKTNNAADALSRRFAHLSTDLLSAPEDLVNIDIKLDPEGEDLPYERHHPASSPIADRTYNIIDHIPRLAMGRSLQSLREIGERAENDEWREHMESGNSANDWGATSNADVGETTSDEDSTPSLVETRDDNISWGPPTPIPIERANPSTTNNTPSAVTWTPYLLAVIQHYLATFANAQVSFNELRMMDYRTLTDNLRQALSSTHGTHRAAMQMATEEFHNVMLVLHETLGLSWLDDPYPDPPFPVPRRNNPRLPPHLEPEDPDLQPPPRLGMFGHRVPRNTRRTEKGGWVDNGPGLEDKVPYRAKGSKLPVPRSRINIVKQKSKPTLGRPKIAQSNTRTIAPPPAPPVPAPLGNVAPEIFPPQDTLPTSSEIFGDYASFLSALKDELKNDAFFRLILDKPTNYTGFKLIDDTLLHTAADGDDVLCIPSFTFKGRRSREIIIDHAHRTIGHMSPRKTAIYIRRAYWWPSLQKDTTKFCVSCSTCQTVKGKTQKPAGLLHSLPIPDRPWKSISMDFVGPFPVSNEHDFIWVIMDRLTSMTHLIPITTKTTASDLAPIFLSNIVRLHGVPESIVSDRDPRFTSKFWRELQRLLGSSLLMSTAFHPETDGLTERRIRTLSSILRSLVSDDQTDWDQQIPITEFALNSAVNVSTGFAPFELNYGFLPSTIPDIPHGIYPGVSDFVERARQYLSTAHDSLIESRVHQAYFANKHRREEPNYQIDNQVYLSTKNLNLPHGRAIKLLPKYIGPYTILGADRSNSTYTLDLPSILAERGLHPVYHVSLLRPFFPSDDEMFPNRALRSAYDLEGPREEEHTVEEILAHRWTGNKLELLIKWSLGVSSWISYYHARHLEALDAYLNLRGVSDWRKLPRAPI